MNISPKRIICLTPETADILYRLGAEDWIVGVSRFTDFPSDSTAKPFVSTFTTFRFDLIEKLKPDLILGFSDLQADAARELVRRGFSVLITNQRTIQEVLDTLILLGNVVGKHAEAEDLVARLERELSAVKATHQGTKRRPRIYFEEWGSPLITGIAWVSELIDAAGGEDAFSELASRRTASERIVAEEEVIQRAPDIIIASWCGKKVNLASIRARRGWEVIPAIQDGEVYEVKSAVCLQPGPVLITEGLKRFRAIVAAWQTRQRPCRLPDK